MYVCVCAFFLTIIALSPHIISTISISFCVCVVSADIGVNNQVNTVIFRKGSAVSIGSRSSSRAEGEETTFNNNKATTVNRHLTGENSNIENEREFHNSLAHGGSVATAAGDGGIGCNTQSNIGTAHSAGGGVGGGGGGAKLQKQSEDVDDLFDFLADDSNF